MNGWCSNPIANRSPELDGQSSGEAADYDCHCGEAIQNVWADATEKTTQAERAVLEVIDEAFRFSNNSLWLRLLLLCCVTQ